MVWKLNWWLHVQSVHITTKVVSLNPAHGEVYSIQHYVIKVCKWLPADQWFSPGTSVSYTNKTDRHDITEILLKVVLNTITPNPNKQKWKKYYRCPQTHRRHRHSIIFNLLYCHKKNKYLFLKWYEFNYTMNIKTT